MDNKKIKTELYNDNFQNYKRYNIPKAQLVIALNFLSAFMDV